MRLLTIFLQHSLPFFLEVSFDQFHKNKHIPFILFEPALDIMHGLVEIRYCYFLKRIDFSDGLFYFISEPNDRDFKFGELAEQKLN